MKYCKSYYFLKCIFVFLFITIYAHIIVMYVYTIAVYNEEKNEIPKFCEKLVRQ